MRNLRDFGFGKSSMEEMIRDEFLDMAENLRAMEGQEVESKHLFNVNIMNIIWRMMSGSRSGYLILKTVQGIAILFRYPNSLG